MVRSTYGALFPIEYKFQGAIIAFTPARVLYTLRLAKNLRQVYVSPFLTIYHPGHWQISVEFLVRQAT